MVADTLEFRTFRGGDEDAVLRLINQETQAQCSLDEWAWAFPHEADGRPIIVGESNGEVVAVCAGAPMDIFFGGRRHPAVEIRRLASRDGDGAKRTVEEYVDAYSTTDRFTLAMVSSFSDRGEYAGFERMTEKRLALLVRENPSPGGPRRLRYRAEPARDWEPRLDRLWERARGFYPAAVVRDAERALRRFAGHPRIRHHRFLVFPRFSRHAVAAAVFSVEGSRCRWLDLIWDHDHPGALELLARISGRLVEQFSANIEELWLAGDEAACDMLSKLGFRNKAVSSFVAARSFDPQLEARGFVDHLYLTAADFETDGW
jgi:hypothetical protein